MSIQSLTPVPGTRPYKLLGGIHLIEIREKRKVLEHQAGKIRMTHHKMVWNEDGNNILWSDIDLEKVFKNKWQMIPEALLPASITKQMEAAVAKKPAVEVQTEPEPVPKEEKKKAKLPKSVKGFEEKTDHEKFSDLELNDNDIRIFYDPKKNRYHAYEEDNLDEPIEPKVMNSMEKMREFLLYYLSNDDE